MGMSLLYCGLYINFTDFILIITYFPAQLQFKWFQHCSHNLHSHNFVCASFITKLFLSHKYAKSLRYIEKIVKKGLHCSFFLSIVHLSGEKWDFVGNYALGSNVECLFLNAILVAT